MSRTKLNIDNIKYTQIDPTVFNYLGNDNWKRNHNGTFACKGKKGSTLPKLTLKEEEYDIYTLWIDFNPSKFFFSDNLYEYCINKNHVIELRNYIESKGINISLNSILTAPINYYEVYLAMLVPTIEKDCFLNNIYMNLYKPQNSVYKVSYESGEGVNISVKHRMLSIYDKSAEITKTNPDIVKDLESKGLTAFKIETKFSNRQECANIAQTYLKEDYLNLGMLINNPDLRQRIIKDYWQGVIEHSLDLNTSKIPLLINKIHKDKTLDLASKEHYLYFLNLTKEYGYTKALHSIKEELTSAQCRRFTSNFKKVIEKHNCHICPDIHALTKRLASTDIVSKNNQLVYRINPLKGYMDSKYDKHYISHTIGSLYSHLGEEELKTAGSKYMSIQDAELYYGISKNTFYSAARNKSSLGAAVINVDGKKLVDIQAMESLINANKITTMTTIL